MFIVRIFVLKFSLTGCKHDLSHPDNQSPTIANSRQPHRPGRGLPETGGGYTLHHAIPETRHDGGEYALLADDVAAKYLATLVAAVTGDQGNAEQVAADWAALQAGEITSAEYTIPVGDFAGVVVRVWVKSDEWTPPDVMG